MKKNRKSFFLITILLLSVSFLSRCINSAKESNDARGIVYADPASCRKCHQAIYDSALLSAHFNASSVAGSNKMQNSFHTGQTSFMYDSITKVAIEKRDSGFYQVLYVNGKETETHSFDIQFGNRNAQTWLYWKADNTFELPLSFYNSINGWATSPGYPYGKPYFKRLIGIGCFECHSSHISIKQDAVIPEGGDFSSGEVTDAFEKKSIIYGIDCQRCHGPAANHVNYHTVYPEEKTAKFIVTINSLNPQQKLDMCAVCHSGNDKEKIQSRFNFIPGDTFSHFYLEMPGYKEKVDYDVHGNQQRLLSESKCFLQGKTLNCSSCHDAHKNASSDFSFYSQKCMECHTEAGNNFCTITTVPAAVLKNNCIDCHMPKKASSAISFYQQGNDQLSSYLLRTHKIAIYKNDADKKH